MPDLIPVEDNPFNVNLVPVDNDPWAAAGTPGPGQMTDADRAQVMRAADTAGGGLLRHFMTPGNVAQGIQTETPGVMTEADAYRMNQLEDQASKFGTQQAFNTVFGNVPMSQAGALGAGGGGIKAAPIVQFRKDAEAIESSLAPAQSGFTRLWRADRPGESGTAYTNSLPGIALPFRKHYGGNLSYVDVPTHDLAKYENTAGTARNAEFNLPAEIAQQRQLATVPGDAINLIPVHHDPFTQ